VSLACAPPVRVETEAPPGADLTRYATFFRAPPPVESDGLPRYDAELGARIQAEIARAFEAKGYRPASPEAADLEVAFRVSGEPRSRLVNASDPDADYQVVEDYVEGALAIEITAAAGGDRLWEGTGQTDLFTSGSLITTDVESAALQAVRDVLRELPGSRVAAPP
jgi:hypothetical protein